MASFPAVSLTKDKVKVRWREPYTSEGLNAKFTGIPRGVYLGFTPSETTPSSNILRLAPDGTETLSVLAVKSNTTTALVHIVETANVDLDFTSHSSFPVYVIAKAVYQVGVETTAQIITQAGAPNGRNEVGICKITSLGPMVIVTDPAVDAAARQQPLARSTQTFGFMSGGSVENLTAAVATTADVNTAKVDTQSVTQATLTARLTADFGGVNLGKTLSRTLEFVKGNAFVAAGVTSKNISGSFAKFDRDVAPAINIAGGGSESADGVITTGTHPLGRNIVYLRDHSGKVPTGVYSGVGIGVYGRVTLATQAMTGTTAFVSAGQGVVGTGTTFTTQCVVGDIIKGGDGNYYEIATITDNTNLTLATAYQSANIAGVTSDRRRFTVTFYTSNAGTETAYTLTSLGMYPYFPVYTSVNIARSGATADGLAGMVPDKLALVDGTTPFTAVQTGVLPTSALHLSTKSYVDGLTYTPAYYRGTYSANGTNTVGAVTLVYGSSVVSSGIAQSATTGEFTFTSPGTYYAFAASYTEQNSANLNITIQHPPNASALVGVAQAAGNPQFVNLACAAIVVITASGVNATMSVGLSATHGPVAGFRTHVAIMRIG